MVYSLDTSDMDRHTVELRLYIEKQKRRFTKAQMMDVYERVVKNVLYPPKERGADDNQQPSNQTSIEIEHMTELEANRLKNFLDDVIAKCFRKEQHEALQKALRESLLQSRRESIKDKFGSEIEPLCFFCASGCSSCLGSKNNKQAPLPTASTRDIESVNQINLFPISPPFSIVAPPTPSPPKDNSPPAGQNSPPPVQTPPIPAEPQAAEVNGKPTSSDKHSSTLSDDIDDDDEQADVDMELGGDAHEDSMHQWFVDQNKDVDKELPRASTPLALSHCILPERDPEKPLSLVIRRSNSTSNSKHFVKSTSRSPAITIDTNSRPVGTTSLVFRARSRSPTGKILNVSDQERVVQVAPKTYGRGRPKTRANTFGEPLENRPFLSQSVAENNSIANASQNRSSKATSQSQAGPRKKTTPFRIGSNKRTTRQNN